MTQAQTVLFFIENSSVKLLFSCLFGFVTHNVIIILK